MTEPLNDPWFEVSYLLTAIETHQGLTKEPDYSDQLLYWQAERARERMGL